MAPPPPAEAHPAGPPPSALLSADGSTVTVDWSSAPDDAAVIGVELGLLAPDAPSAFLDGPPEAEPSADEIAALSASPALREYLLDHVRVVQDGSDCRGSVEPVDDFLEDGARLVFDCPAPVTVVDVEITLLTPIDETYRSFGVSREDAEPDVAVFTAGTAMHTWDFTADTAGEATGSAAALMIVGALAAAGAVGGGVLGLLRRPSAPGRPRRPSRGKRP